MQTYTLIFKHNEILLWEYGKPIFHQFFL